MFLTKNLYKVPLRIRKRNRAWVFTEVKGIRGRLKTSFKLASNKVYKILLNRRFWRDTRKHYFGGVNKMRVDGGLYDYNISYKDFMSRMHHKGVRVNVTSLKNLAIYEPLTFKCLTVLANSPTEVHTLRRYKHLNPAQFSYTTENRELLDMFKFGGFQEVFEAEPFKFELFEGNAKFEEIEKDFYSPSLEKFKSKKRLTHEILPEVGRQMVQDILNK